MFSSIGWVEIFVVIVVGLIVIGPERLPGVIMDVRAAIFAARKAINNAKAELSGEFGEEFDEFRKPINTVTEYAAMGPKAAIAKVLFNEDGDFLDQFDPRVAMDEAPKTALNSQIPSENGSAPSAQADQPAAADSQGEERHADEGVDYSTAQAGLAKSAYSPSEPKAKNPNRRRRHQPGMLVQMEIQEQEAAARRAAEGSTSTGAGSGGFSWADIT